MDVVEKVQSVLKSAMNKPLSTLSGSHPMIPENVNVEWSNILPAILAGDKYGNKVEESHYVEKPTSKPSSSAIYVVHKQNNSVSDSLKPDVSETVAQAKPENTNKYTNERNEQIKKNETLPTIATKPTTISYTEKLMIPVSVITTEQNVELMAHNRYTTQSSILHKVTGAIPLSESTTTYGFNVRDKENLASTSAITKPTTTGVSVSSNIGESIKNSYDNIGLTASETLQAKYNTSHIDETVTDQTVSLVTQTKTKPTTDISNQEYDKVPLKTQTPSMMEANQVQNTNKPFSKLPSQSSLPFTKPPLQFSVSFTKLPPQSSVSTTSTPASTNKYRTTTLVPSTTIHDTVTKASDPLSEPIEPPKSSPSMELVNSLSNVISQISNDVSPVLSSSFGFQSIPTESEGKRNDSSEITTHPSTTNDDRLENANNTSEERIQESSSEMTMKFDADQEKISSITISAPIVSMSTTELDKTANVSDISTKSDSITSVQTNVTEPTTNINETPVTSSNVLQAIALIESMLHTASPATNRPIIESITLPNDLSDDLLPNTVASSLIADSYLSNSKTNKTQAVFKETTVSSPEKLNSTETVTSNSELSTSVNEDGTNDTTKKDSTNENEIYRTSTTKDDLFTDQQKIESSLLKNELSTASETTTVASSTLDVAVKTTVADGISTSFANNALNEQTSTYETTISSNEASTSTNTGSTIANTENITEGASQNNDKTSITYLEYTTETSSEHDKQTFTYQTVIDELSTNLSESSTVIANLSNAEEHPVESSTDKIVLQSPLKKTEEQAKNDTVHAIVNQQKINILGNATMNQHETDILNNATMNEHKINILNDTAANQHKINILNNTAVNQHKTNILSNTTVNQHKTNILSNTTVNQHKTNILNNATMSQHKTNILSNTTTNQHKTNILNNTNVNEHKINILTNTSEDQHKINILNNTTTTPLSDTKSSVVSSTPESITTALNSITEESNEIKGSTMNSVDWNRSENKTKIPVEIYSYKSNVSMNNSIGTQLLGAASKLHSNESHINQKMNDSPSSMLQSKMNNTSINQHTWQRISLHQVIPSSTEFTTGSTTSTKHLEASTSTMSTMVDASSTKYPSNYQSTPANKAESTVSLNASKSIGGLDTSTSNASADIINFSRLCNELAIKFWVAANSKLSTGRSLVLSPFGMTSLLAMIFLGARGSTSDQMNEILGLDNVATFNPHLIFQNVTDTVSLARHQGIANAAFVRELFADKAKVRRLLPFYKEQAQQFYEGLVTEVNFATISDLVRRRTNLLIRKQTGGRIKDFVKSNTVPLRSPLATISANVFQTDCNTSSASTTGRDGELYFAVSAAHRLRKLIPVPATVWRSNVLAGYEPSLDATVSAIGSVDKLVSTIFLVPGQQGHAAPGDTLDRLEQRFIKEAFQDGAWDKLLKVLIPRPSLELQVPKFSHRSIVNATAALKRMGLDQLFSSNADFKGINGIGNRLFLSDVLQVILQITGSYTGCRTLSNTYSVVYKCLNTSVTL